MKELSGAIKSLSDRFAPEQSGGKAWGLHQIQRAGYKTMTGYVLLEPLREYYLKSINLEKEIKDFENCLLQSEPEAVLKISEAIRSRIIESKFGPPLYNLFLELYHNSFAGKSIVVRSSAHGEDSPSNSFAGQFDSFLNIASFDEMLIAIRKTWASLWNERAVYYQKYRNVIIKKMGVIIQEEANPLFSGVLFTESPSSHNGKQEMIIEYCHGFGDKLVSGDITPSEIIVHRNSMKTVKSSVQSINNTANQSSLFDATIHELARSSLKLEKFFNTPLDIEWCIDKNNKIIFLQARPITTNVKNHLSPGTSEPGSSTTPLCDTPSGKAEYKPLITWTNTNIVENYPEPVVPLLYSIARLSYAAYFRNLGLGFGLAPQRIKNIEEKLSGVVGVHMGRLYYNLSNIHNIIREAPLGNWLIKLFNDFIGASDFPERSQQQMSLSTIQRLREIVVIPFNIIKRFFSLNSGLRQFEKEVDNFCQKYDQNMLDTASLTEYKQALEDFLHIRLNRWNRAALADTSAMLAYGILKATVKKIFKKDNENLHNNLLKGISSLASNEPVIKLWNLSREIKKSPKLCNLFIQNSPEKIELLLPKPEFRDLQKKFSDYLNNWGFRSSGELMLTEPGPLEEPLNTIGLLKLYIEKDGPAPGDLLEKQTKERDQLLKKLFKKYSTSYFKRAFLRIILRTAWRAIDYRERARFRQARLYVRLRLILIAAGRKLNGSGLLKNPDDLLYLNISEVDDLISGYSQFPEDLAELVSIRKKRLKEMCGKRPPDSFKLPPGQYLNDGEMINAFNTDSAKPLSSQLKQTSITSQNRLTGAAVCGGVITGPAAIMFNAAEGQRLKEGEILVTPQTDPGWAAVFFLVKGLIVERGGMLSHGAIIAREYGIPAIVGVNSATSIIKNGSTIRLNGDQGVIELL